MIVMIEINGPFPENDQRRLEAKISDLLQIYLDREYGQSMLEVDDVSVDL